MWDLERPKAPVTTFVGHGGDVASIAVHPTDDRLILTGSCDCSTRLWDVRTGKSAMTFPSTEGDINAVAFMRNGMCLGMGSEEGIGHLVDLRSYAVVNTFASELIDTVVSSLAFSRSGRLVFLGCDDSVVYVWDTLLERVSPIQALEYHEGRIADVKVPASGQCVAMASWDSDVSVWA